MDRPITPRRAHRWDLLRYQTIISRESTAIGAANLEHPVWQMSAVIRVVINVEFRQDQLVIPCDNLSSDKIAPFNARLRVREASTRHQSHDAEDGSNTEMASIRAHRARGSFEQFSIIARNAMKYFFIFPAPKSILVDYIPSCEIPRMVTEPCEKAQSTTSGPNCCVKRVSRGQSVSGSMDLD